MMAGRYWHQTETAEAVSQKADPQASSKELPILEMYQRLLTVSLFLLLFDAGQLCET